MKQHTSSKDHVAFGFGFEFFHGPDGVLYQAPLSCPMGLDGYRQGARFECQPRSDGHAHFMSVTYDITLGTSKNSAQ